MNNMWGDMAQYGAIYWPWPIAVYLFLAGLSAGCTIVALLVKWNKHSDNTSSIWDAMVKAGAITAPVTIIIGLLLLIFDLGKPLSFYWLLISYNFGSVMSLGVLFLLVYTPLSVLFAFIIFEDSIEKSSVLSVFSFIPRIIRSFASISKLVEYILLILAICVGMYTGFLLSAISKIPLWNTPILPILFLVSGFSSGIAANILIGMAFFKGSLNKDSIKYLLVLDLRAILFELPLLFILFIGMNFQGGQSAVAAAQALSDPYYGKLFWIAVVGIGLLMPIVIAATALKNHAYKPGFIILNSVVVLVGVIALRYYIVYAGQLFTGV
ncbi:protein NrfD [Campylobacter sputorum subsp. bubulus]|uniref:Protein NrfD n=1 Tax=Campylobacter sputorum subsp. sputorum TaxID=32024 RepID=A0A381DL81_9BACT|nr:NrfD/PsrC family molybdoenzyme membrane anchor subunit [Campylobacter sputorum]ASM34718.1 putative thiosulfate/polysulfide reductase, membrane-anchoring subunit [Campylobacter sputorum aubsp. sputorum RM3237]ASM38066.1 putative thiosulfate/polysulfide reductase, membrane-anchoring subunit [Campylobacter sputorum bv. paraureolyticus LMG 11764]KAB0581721.1 polysulfide reductase [Campylobacter sputorum subsp. sputorum]MDY6121213.1 NrfD/PsrC family molybdoenzyme membrane anchor subunit [Campylob